jgi:hypothetical protein
MQVPFPAFCKEQLCSLPEALGARRVARSLQARLILHTRDDATVDRILQNQPGPLRRDLLLPTNRPHGLLNPALVENFFSPLPFNIY